MTISEGLELARVGKTMRARQREYNQTGSALALAEMKNLEWRFDALLAEVYSPPLPHPDPREAISND